MSAASTPATPRRPMASRRAVSCSAPASSSPTVAPVIARPAPVTRRLTRRVTGAGLAMTGATVGLDEAGALHETALRDAIGRLGVAGVDAADIVCHPGEAG